MSTTPIVSTVPTIADDQLLTLTESAGFFSSLWSHKQWTPTNSDLLKASEARLLKALRGRYEHRMVDIDGGHQINTLVMGQGPPLVLIHGWGGGIGIWVANLDDLAQHFTVYACDLLGFGRSSRPEFLGSSGEEGEWFFLSSIKAWIDALGIAKFIILGHSMGAYLSALFALQWPSHVEKLILADPWGVPKIPFDPAQRSFRYRALTAIASYVGSPFALLRAAGPFGLSLLQRVRPDLSSKFVSHLGAKEHFESYVYHCNVQNPSGERAFEAFTIPGAWARSPLVERLTNLDRRIPIFSIYGKESWMDFRTMDRLRPELPHQFEIVLLPNAGHHVYIDNFIDFNRGVCLAALHGTMKELIEELAVHQDFSQTGGR